MERKGITSGSRTVNCCGWRRYNITMKRIKAEKERQIEKR